MYSQIIILCSILLYPQDFNAIVWSWFWSPCSVSKGEFGCLFVFSTWSLFLMIKFYFHYLIFKYFFLYLMFYCLKYDLFNNLISISYLMSTFLFTFWTLLKVWCFILTLFFLSGRQCDRLLWGDHRGAMPFSRLDYILYLRKWIQVVLNKTDLFISVLIEHHPYLYNRFIESCLLGYENPVSRSHCITVSHCLSDASTRGIAVVPKLALDVGRCEVLLVMQLTDNCIIPISYQVPRKVRAGCLASIENYLMCYWKLQSVKIVQLNLWKMQKWLQKKLLSEKHHTHPPLSYSAT